MNSHCQTVVGVQANIAYLTAAGDGPVEARATDISRGRKLATYGCALLQRDDFAFRPKRARAPESEAFKAAH